MENTKISASDYVYKVIEEKIFSGQWLPGSKITSEVQLAKELNVSRVSVREAIEKMVALDILTKKQGGGTYVNELGPTVYLNSLIPMITLEQDNYLDILEFRLILEVESARLCAERGSVKIFEDLEKIYNKMLEFKENPEEFSKADMDFHMKIAEGTGNSLIIKVNKVLKNLLEYHQRSLYKSLGPEGGILDHKKILEAIKNRDLELSTLFMGRHIKRTIKDLKNQGDCNGRHSV